MGELGEALALVHGARHRFTTLRAEGRTRYDPDLGQRAYERFARTPSGRAAGFDEPLEDDEEDELALREERWRIWIEKPDRIREERERPDRRMTLEIAVGELWWMYDPEFGPHSNEDEPHVGSSVGDEYELLLDPSPLLGRFRFDVRGREQVAGRDAIRLRGERRMLESGWFGRHDFDEALELELAVDAKRGILLRYAAVLDGEPYHTTELTEVAFDERFPGETFTFVLPPGETRHPRRVEARELTLAEAAARAGFTVFALALPEEWSCRSLFTPADESWGTPAVVTLRYRLADASHAIDVSELPEGARDELDEAFEWEPREVQGRQVDVLSARFSGQAAIRVERERTRIAIRSETLGVERLVELLERLTPVA